MVLNEIDRDACIELMKTQSVGRLAVADHGYYPPHIVPVNFAVDGDAVVFRSDGRAELLTQEQVDALPHGEWLQPWAPGARRTWVRIVPYTITGRRLQPVPMRPGSAA
jgi:hypothetical protein